MEPASAHQNQPTDHNHQSDQIQITMSSIPNTEDVDGIEEWMSDPNFVDTDPNGPAPAPSKKHGDLQLVNRAWNNLSSAQKHIFLRSIQPPPAWYPPSVSNWSFDDDMERDLTERIAEQGAHAQEMQEDYLNQTLALKLIKDRKNLKADPQPWSQEMTTIMTDLQDQRQERTTSMTDLQDQRQERTTSMTDLQDQRLERTTSITDLQPQRLERTTSITDLQPQRL